MCVSVCRIHCTQQHCVYLYCSLNVGLCRRFCVRLYSDSQRVRECKKERERESYHDAHSIVSIFIVAVEFPYSFLPLPLLYYGAFKHTQDNGTIYEEERAQRTHTHTHKKQQTTQIEIEWKYSNAIMFSNMEFFAQYKNRYCCLLLPLLVHGNGCCRWWWISNGMSGAKRQIPLICK